MSGLSPAPERAAFWDDLSRELTACGYGFVRCDLGYTARLEPVWHITLHHPHRGVLLLEAAFPAGTAPYAGQTRRQLLWRIIRALRAEAPT